jgi:hypothetical protein
LREVSGDFSMTHAELLTEKQRLEKLISDCDRKIAVLREKKL